MTNRGKIFLIIAIVILAFMLVWPNIGERTVKVYFNSGLTEKQLSTSMEQLEDFLTENYKDRYSWEKSSEKEDEDELNEESLDFVKKDTDSIPIYLIKGNFIQASFINELSRIAGINGEKTLIVPIWVEKKLKAKPFKLGLDLQGGMNLILEGDFEKLREQLNRRYNVEYMVALDKKILEEKDEDKKKSLEFDKSQIEDAKNFTEDKKREYIRGAIEIIRSRIDKTGVSEPLIRLQGFDKIEIGLPGVASPERAKKMISSTARVEYHLGEKEDASSGGKYTRIANEKILDFRKLTSESERINFIDELTKEIKLPKELGIYVNWDKPKNSPHGKLSPTSFIVLENKVALSGDDIAPNTYVGFDAERIQNTINFQLTPEGTKKFADLTSKNKGRQLAILIDEKVRSAPSINGPILGGSAVINGSFTQQEAKDLALIIKEGSLPVPLKIVEERSVGPSLGQESIEKGVTAIWLGFLAVMIFMLIYYKAAGIIANFALTLNLVLMAAFLAWMDFTITLPGLAGVVLTLGMAVDANVIIYERIREELARGKSIKLATAQGFERATLTILDSNFTTMVAAIVLSKFGVGPIKGFAVTLFLGILTSLFTALFVSKTLFFIMVYDLNFKSLPIGWSKKYKVGGAS